MDLFYKRHTVRGNISSEGNLSKLALDPEAHQLAELFMTLQADYVYENRTGNGLTESRVVYSRPDGGQIELLLGQPESVRDSNLQEVQAYPLTVRYLKDGQPDWNGDAYHLGLGEDGIPRVLRFAFTCSLMRDAEDCVQEELHWDFRGHWAPLGIGYWELFTGDASKGLFPVRMDSRSPMFEGTFTRISYEQGSPLEPIPPLRKLPAKPAPAPAPMLLFPGANKTILGEGVSPQAGFDGLLGLAEARQAKDAIGDGGCVRGIFTYISGRATNPVQGALYYSLSQRFEMQLISRDGGGTLWKWEWIKEYEKDMGGQVANERERYSVISREPMAPPIDCQTIRAAPAPSVDAMDHFTQVAEMPWYETWERGAFYFGYGPIGDRSGEFLPIYGTAMYPDASGWGGLASQLAFNDEWLTLVVAPGGCADI